MHHRDIVVVLYNIRSRFNVGALFRTADAAGVKRMILCGITPQPPHPKIDKVALGAEKTVPFTYYRQTKRALDDLHKQGYQLIALEQSAESIHYTKLKYPKRCALLIGNEVSGLPYRLLKQCDHIIEIPMHGRKESLNVGIATGIILFDSIRK
ncbi:MAG: RNA methyltransferase [Candidatus Kerfeldbacteria bacterium]|nr:RNA methyltransferase [Candidatus Kerfeldbacteria bacterium]